MSDRDGGSTARDTTEGWHRRRADMIISVLGQSGAEGQTPRLTVP